MRHVSLNPMLLAFVLALAMVLAAGPTRALDDNWMGAGKAAARKSVPAAKAAQKPDYRRNAATTEAALESVPERLRADPKPTAARSFFTEIRQFCVNNAAAASSARVAWQAAKLAELDARLKQRIAELEAKRAEYEAWLRKRDEAMKKAQDGVVAIYAKMAPEAAASQFAAMDDVTAAALLAKLNSRSASAILAEMDPGRAAHLANAMVGSPNADDGKKS